MATDGVPNEDCGAQLSLSELVEATGVPASTVHHYLRAELVPPPIRLSANRFAYDQRHVTALRLVRVLRDRRGLGLDEIAEQLPALLADDGTLAQLAEADPDPETDTRERIVAAGIEAFSTRTFGEVTVSDVAERAGVGKGSFYRHFTGKEDLFVAGIEAVLVRTADGFADAVRRIGGAEGVADQPERTAVEFATLVADAMPMLLEVGARAAKGHQPSEALARRVLRTLAEATGRPLLTASSDADPVGAGLGVIQQAFTLMLTWAVGTEWPPDERLGDGPPTAGAPPPLT